MPEYEVTLNGDGKFYVLADNLQEASEIVKQAYPNHQGFRIEPHNIPKSAYDYPSQYKLLRQKT